MGRIFRSYQLAKLIHSCHAPGSSARNWPIEGAWPSLRRKLLGQELGRSVASSREHLWAMFEESSPDVNEARENAIRAVTDKGAQTLANLASQCYVGERPWNVQIISEADAGLPLIPDIKLIVEYFQAGVRQRTDARFESIAQEAADFALHYHKGPSHSEYTFCCHDMCKKCADIFAARQQKDPRWHPRVLLSQLGHQSYLLPWPVPSSGLNEDGDDCVVPDEESNAAEVLLETKREELRSKMMEAASREEFLLAAEYQRELEELPAAASISASAASSSSASCFGAQQDEASSQQSQTVPTFQAVYVSEQDPKVVYPSFSEVLQARSQANLVSIPVSKNKRRLESVLTCPQCSRYIAKTQTELMKHQSHFHGKRVLKRSEPQPAEEPVLFRDFSVAGVAPVPDKRRKRDFDDGDLEMQDDERWEVEEEDASSHPWGNFDETQ